MVGTGRDRPFARQSVDIDCHDDFHFAQKRMILSLGYNDFFTAKGIVSSCA
jgi:hypothetical protein